MIVFRCWHTDQILGTSDQATTNAGPSDVLRVEMEGGSIRMMVVHSRTVHITENPERTVLRVSELDVELQEDE